MPRNATTDPSSTPLPSLADARDALACPSRRSVLCSLAALGGVALAPATLVGCDSDSGEGTGGSGSSASGPSGSVAASEVPVGQAVVTEVGGSPVVLAQPSQGSYVGFSAICTHQGATVQTQNGLVLHCPLHGSEFDAGEDGAVVQGPATEPLPALTVTVEGDNLIVS